MRGAALFRANGRADSGRMADAGRIMPDSGRMHPARMALPAVSETANKQKHSSRNPLRSSAVTFADKTYLSSLKYPFICEKYGLFPCRVFIENHVFVPWTEGTR